MRLSVLLLLALVGCPLPMPRPTPPDGPSEPFPRPPTEGVSLAHAPDLRAFLKAPSRTPYVIEALGVGGRSVSIRLTNTGARSVDFGRFRIAFTAAREGVSFLCKEHVGGSVKDREPTSLAARQSFVFERDLDCTMPLPGRYDVGVYVALRDGSQNDRGDFVGAFSLDVVEGNLAPRPYPSRPGLYVVMTGSRATRPLPPEAWTRGDYHVVVAVVNGSSRPVPVGQARLAFLTYKKGSPLPCSGQAEAVAFPEELAPGSVHVIQAPVACAPSEEGRYEIVGRLTLNDVGEEVEIGRVALKVTRDPLLFAPEPWPSWGDRPATSWTK